LGRIGFKVLEEEDELGVDRSLLGSWGEWHFEDSLERFFG